MTTSRLGSNPQSDCPHYINQICEIATEIAGKSCKPDYMTCICCQACERPQRLNTFTAALAHAANPEIDITNLARVISGEQTGFGTRLATFFGPFFQKLPGCGCEGHRDILDVWTKEYVTANLEKVINWLQNEARKRELPFSRFLIKTLLKSLLKNQ